MAGTISARLEWTVSNGNFSDSMTLGPTSITQTTEGGGNPGYVNIGTSEEDISFGDVTPRFVLIENLDGTNFLKYGPKSGGAMIAFGRVAPGAFALLEMAASVTLRCAADTAAVNVRIRGYNA